MEIIGAFRVNKVNMLTSNVQYTVLFLKDRLVFARTGGQFADLTLPGIGSDTALSVLTRMSVEQIIAMHKKNIQILYGEITRVDLGRSMVGVNGGRAGTITIHHGKKDKFDLALGQKYEACLNVVRSALPDKLSGSQILATAQTSTLGASMEPGARMSAQPPATAIPTGEAGIDQSYVRLERAMKQSANWFFIIAGLSFVNAIIYAFGEALTFVVGLGATQFTAAVAKVAEAPEVSAAAAFFTMLLIAAFIAFGVFSRRGITWVFVVGTAVYVLDALLLLILFDDWLGMIFHIIALFFLYSGLFTAFKLEKLKKGAI